ncbi:calcium-binding protein [Acidisoma sp. L85]|uniref:beta strand repeat-containing protein n=1 Tax=Acidisoma sp. L85 TaxID=1641850 RepID=UPI00131D6535|nr:calcium-binding protein [Acidisoma sp. L85]
MANFVFDGTKNVTLTSGNGFDPATDTVSIANKVLVGATYTPSPGLTTGTVVFTAADGATLTLNNVTPDILQGDGTLTSPLGTVTLGLTTGATTLTGNLSVGFGQGDTIAQTGAGGTAFGGDGANPINDSATTAGQLIYGGTGINDSIDLADSIAGSNFADTIYGNGGDDIIAGGAGGDQINGGGGDDTISGPDNLNAPPLLTASFTTGAVLWGATGDDSIDATGSTAGITIFGGSGINDSADLADTLVGGSGADTIYGNGGDDSIAGGGGADSINGGVGNDTISGNFDATGASGTSSTAMILGGSGADSITSTGLQGATIFGGNGINDSTDGADTITGGVGADTIYGNGGDDSIAGGGGADSINGGAGNDTISGDFDNVVSSVSGAMIFGATGSDVIDASTTTQAITIFGGSGVTDSADGADTILGGVGSVTGAGATLANTVADTIYGNGGDDAILTNGGADVVNGGAGNDIIFDSGVGAAQLTGAGGNNVFAFENSAGALPYVGTVASHATVTDFTQGSDLLDVGETVSSVLASTSVAALLGTSLGAGQVAYTADGSGNELIGYNNTGAAGAAANTFVALGNSTVALTTSDFTHGTAIPTA